MAVLSGTRTRCIRPGESPLRVDDERGLDVEITANGVRRWRFKYRDAGKEKRLLLHTRPDAGLKAVRDRRDRERALLEGGAWTLARHAAQTRRTSQWPWSTALKPWRANGTQRSLLLKSVSAMLHAR
jgi:hypothetical protein